MHTSTVLESIEELLIPWLRLLPSAISPQLLKTWLEFGWTQCAIALNWLSDFCLGSLMLFWAFLIQSWPHLVFWMQFPIGYALVSELLQLGLSSTNCTLEWSEALPFYLCSAALTICFWCDGTNRTLSQVLKLWWLVWMYFFFFHLLLSLPFFNLFFPQRDFFHSHWHYSVFVFVL